MLGLVFTGAQYSALSTQYSVLSTQYSVLRNLVKRFQGKTHNNLNGHSSKAFAGMND